MRRRLLALSLLSTLTLLPHADAATTALVVPDPTGDANYSGLHGQSAPQLNQAAQDIVSVTFDTTKTYATKKVRGKRVVVATPTGLLITLRMATAPSTLVTSSYGVVATHSVCGQMRLQIYYTESGATTYGDLASCGTDGPATSPEQFAIEFSPKISGNNLVLAIPFKLLPPQFKAGTQIAEIVAYTSTAEPVVAGYQPTDFDPDAGIDIAAATKPWKVA